MCSSCINFFINSLILLKFVFYFPQVCLSYRFRNQYFVNLLVSFIYLFNSHSNQWTESISGMWNWGMFQGSHSTNTWFCDVLKCQCTHEEDLMNCLGISRILSIGPSVYNWSYVHIVLYCPFLLFLHYSIMTYFASLKAGCFWNSFSLIMLCAKLLLPQKTLSIIKKHSWILVVSW